jgi:hypothetical protein
MMCWDLPQAAAFCRALGCTKRVTAGLHAVHVKSNSPYGRAKPGMTGLAFHWCGADCLKRDYEQDDFLQKLASPLAAFQEKCIKAHNRKRRQGEAEARALPLPTRVSLKYTLVSLGPFCDGMTLLTPRLCSVRSLGSATDGTKARQVEAAAASCEGDTRTKEQRLQDARALNDCYQGIHRRPEVTAYIDAAKDEEDAFDRRHRVSNAERGEVHKCLLLQVRHPFSESPYSPPAPASGLVSTSYRPPTYHPLLLCGSRR